MDIAVILNNAPRRVVKTSNPGKQRKMFDKPKPSQPPQRATVTTASTKRPATDFELRIKAKKPKTRRERRLFQREYLDYILDTVQEPIAFDASQLQNLDFSGPSKNIDIETNCDNVVLHMAISTAEKYATEHRSGLVYIIPKRNTGAGQGQVGTQLKGCNLRLKPIKSSKIVMVPFPKPPAYSTKSKRIASEASETPRKTIRNAPAASKAPKRDFCKVKREDSGEASDAVSALMNLKEKSWDAKKRKRRTAPVDVPKPLKRRRLEPSMPMKKKALKIPAVPKQITVHYRDQSESFGVWYGCLAGHILNHITKLDVFGIGDYSRCYLRDSAGSIVLENAPFFTIHAAGGLFLEH